jgi:hypothetical protein
MITDPLPRQRELRRQYEASDARPTMQLPPAAPLQLSTAAFKEALAAANARAVKRVGQQILTLLAVFYDVPTPELRVLGARPRKVIEDYLSFELFGDYTPATQVIRIWMRTAVRAKVTSHRGLLNTLLHEFCHHLDVHAFDLPETPHTRGFFARVDELYHLALATPPEARRPLVWIKQGSAWRIDWRQLRPKGPRP